MPCGSLSSLLVKQMNSKQPLYSDKDAIRWMSQVATELAGLHDSSPKIIYRHLEPASILLSSTDTREADASFLHSGERQRSSLNGSMHRTISQELNTPGGRLNSGTLERRRSGTETSPGPLERLGRHSTMARGSRETSPSLGMLTRVSSAFATRPRGRLPSRGRRDEEGGTDVTGKIRRQSLELTLSGDARAGGGLLRRSLSAFRAGGRAQPSPPPETGRDAAAKRLSFRSMAAALALRGSSPDGTTTRSEGQTERRNPEWESRTLSGRLSGELSDNGTLMSSRRGSLEIFRKVSPPKEWMDVPSEITAMATLDAINEQRSLRIGVPRSVFAELASQYAAQQASAAAAGGEIGLLPVDLKEEIQPAQPTKAAQARPLSRSVSATRQEANPLEPPDGQQFLARDAAAGSSMYMPPEVYRKERHTIEADIFSLGLIMYEVFSRELRAIRMNINGANPERVRAHAREMAYGYRPNCGKNFPQAVVDLIEDCLEDNPADRPSAAEVAKALAAISVPLTP